MTEFLERKEQVGELLRLWKSTLLTEEAIQKTLLPVAPEVAKLEGRSYFKLSLLDEEADGIFDFLLGELSSIRLPVRGEQVPFLEYLAHQDALSKKYRQPIKHDFIIGFPSFYYRDRFGKEKLTTLFKFPLRELQYPLLPDASVSPLDEESLQSITPLRLDQELQEEKERSAQYWLDEFFIQEELGIPDEDLLAFRKTCKKNKFTAQDFFAQFCKTILKEEEVPPATEGKEKQFEFLLLSLGRFIRRMENFGQNRQAIRVFPFALLYELDHIQPTRQLQNDLDDILSMDLVHKVGKKHPASYYLFGNNKEKRLAPFLLGQYKDTPLTESQDLAIRAAKKRKLTTIKGPPGTGKTHIIRNLMADLFVRFVHQISSPDEQVKDFRWISLVTSSNNRAVDNALEGMNVEGLLPIALRMGSRIILSNATLHFLQNYAKQLEAKESYKEIKPFYIFQKDLRDCVKKIKSLSESKNSDSKKLSELRFEAYILARKTLDAWVGCNKSKLLDIIGGVIDDISDRRGLRTLKRPINLNMFLTIFPLIGSTLLSLRNFFPMEEDSIGQVIIDEAGQCTPNYLLPALLRSKKSIMIGDTMQLEPVAKLRQSEIEMLRSKRNINLDREKSIFFSSHVENPRSSQHIAQEACEEVLELQEHFRCRRDIIQVSMDLCNYNLNLRGEHQDSTAALQFLEVAGTETRYGSSWANELEVEKILLLLQSLKNSGYSLDEIAILTPYRGQLNHINYSLRRRHIPFNASEGSTDTPGAVATGTVHRFQGGERRVVLFSHVISQGVPQFLNSRVNLLNVAVSRAQSCFIFVGSLDALSRGSYTALLREHLLTRGQRIQI